MPCYCVLMNSLLSRCKEVNLVVWKQLVVPPHAQVWISKQPWLLFVRQDKEEEQGVSWVACPWLTRLILKIRFLKTFRILSCLKVGCTHQPSLFPLFYASQALGNQQKHFTIWFPGTQLKVTEWCMWLLLLSRTVPQSFLWFQGLSLPVPLFSVSCLLLRCWLWNLYNVICRSSLNCFQVEIKCKHGEFLSSFGDMYNFFGVWEWYGCKVLGLHMLPCFLGHASISWWTATAAFVLNGRGQGCRKNTCSYKVEVL